MKIFYNKVRILLHLPEVRIHLFLVDCVQFTNSITQVYHLSFSVVSHDIATKECRRKMAEAYELNKRLNGLISEEDLENLKRNSEEQQSQKVQTKRKRQTLIDWIPAP